MTTKKVTEEWQDLVRENFKCLICGHGKFTLIFPGRGKDARYYSPHYPISVGEPHDPEGIWGALEVALISCEKCGFVHAFDSSVMMKEVDDTTGDLNDNGK